MNILAVNPGSTSTKIGVFRTADAGREGSAADTSDGDAGATPSPGDAVSSSETTIGHRDEALAPFARQPVIEQLPMRLEAVLDALEAMGVAVEALDAVAGRGGLLAPVPSGTFAVNEAMLGDLWAARRGEHASNLGAFLAHEIGKRASCPAFIVDPVSVDEWEPVARLSGLAGLDRECLSHALNTKAVAKRYARENGRSYNELRLVVAHLGSGVSVSAHRDGRMVDVCNPREEGPFSADRAGALPAMKLLDLAFTQGTTRDELERRIFREGGVYSYTGTRDLEQVGERIEAGDETAALVVDAMLYQIAREIGAMAAVLQGRLDAVLLTGGMTHARRVVQGIEAAVAWIAPVHVYPGEDELRALADGALRVLRGEEKALVYPGAEPAPA